MNNQGNDALSLKRNNDFSDLKITKNSPNRLNTINIVIDAIFKTEAIDLFTDTAAILN